MRELLDTNALGVLDLEAASFAADSLGGVMTWDVLVQQLWVQTIAAVAAAVIFAVLVGAWRIAVKQQTKFWPAILRALRWPFTLRLTTTQRQGELAAAADGLRKDADRFREVCDLLQVWPVLEHSRAVRDRIEQLQKASTLAAAEAKAKIEAAKERTNKQIVDAIRVNEGQVELARSEGRKDGYAEAMAEVAEQRAVGTLRPVWNVRPLSTADGSESSSTYMLMNVQEDAAASDVGLSSPMADFVFHSPNQWSGAFTSPVMFAGERAGTGRMMDVKFAVRYRDANGDWQPGEAVLTKRSSPKPALPRIAKRGPEDDLRTMPF